jgi:hypothetical protein
MTKLINDFAIFFVEFLDWLSDFIREINTVLSYK